MNTLKTLLLSLIVIISTCSCSKDDNPTPDECSVKCDQLPAVGTCKAAITKYYFDHQTGKCIPFTWGGCGGSVPFETLDECLSCGCK